jgi:TonB family protein
VKLDLVRSSGNQDTDQAAIDAVKRAAPFDPLPSDYRGTNVDIKFTFDINVFGGGVDDGRGY